MDADDAIKSIVKLIQSMPYTQAEIDRLRTTAKTFLGEDLMKQLEPVIEQESDLPAVDGYNTLISAALGGMDFSRYHTPEDMIHAAKQYLLYTGCRTIFEENLKSLGTAGTIKWLMGIGGKHDENGK